MKRFEIAIFCCIALIMGCKPKTDSAAVASNQTEAVGTSDGFNRTVRPMTPPAIEPCTQEDALAAANTGRKSDRQLAAVRR